MKTLPRFVEWVEEVHEGFFGNLVQGASNLYNKAQAHAPDWLAKKSVGDMPKQGDYVNIKTFNSFDRGVFASDGTNFSVKQGSGSMNLGTIQNIQAMMQSGQLTKDGNEYRKGEGWMLNLAQKA